MSIDKYEDMPPKSGKIFKQYDTIVDEGQTTEDLQHPVTPTTTAFVAATAGVELTYAIPAGTKKLAMKLRGEASAFTYAWSSDKLTSAPITIPAGGDRVLDGVNIGGQTIHFTAAVNTQIFEIETWA